MKPYHAFIVVLALIGFLVLIILKLPDRSLIEFGKSNGKRVMIAEWGVRKLARKREVLSVSGARGECSRAS